jgi:GTP pyrophosphokinase
MANLLKNMPQFTEPWFETDQVKQLYEKFLEKCVEKITTEDLLPVKQAFAITSVALKGMFRKSGEPYIVHPLLVATIVVDEIGLAKNSTISALMHDLVESENIQRQQVLEIFGETVVGIIEGLNKISGLYSANIDSQNEKYIDLLLSIVPDVRIILVKLADRLHTIRSIDKFDDEKKINLAMEAGAIYAPIAHRLGLYAIKAELEELWLKYTKPGVFNNIITRLEETSSEREKYITQFVEPLKIELTEKGFHFELKSRVKSIFSIWKKMETQHVRFEDVFDLFAIRIILDDIDPKDEKMACWTAYSIVSNLYTPNPTRMRDWISTPRKSGYESLHATVLGQDKKMWVEVQIRTKRMDEVAEKGTAAHWRYKEVTGGQTHQQWLASIREILENPDISEDETQFKATDDPTKDIFVFTPKGELKQLSYNATVIDFAYSIHSNIGDKCTGARVNGRMAPIRHVLKSGDTVDIITSKNQTPNESWLNFAVSSKARNRIKRSLKDQTYREAEIGKENLHRKLSQAGLNIPDEFLVLLLKKFGFKNIVDLYQNFALGKIDFTTIKGFIAAQSSGMADEEVKPLTLAPKKRKSKGADDDYLIVDKDISRIDYVLAKCCNPIFGDPIFGFISIEKGITIHRQNCPNAPDLTGRYPYRIIKARWNRLDPDGRFMVNIRVTGIDQRGMLNQLSKLIVDDLHLQLTSVHIDTDDGFFNGTFTVYVKDITHMDFLIQQIMKTNGVLRVDRIGD